MNDMLRVFPERIQLERQQAVLQQIDMAIELLGRRQWPCAITLALAAEGQMPSPTKPFVAGVLNERFGKWFIEEMNRPRNWLKHAREPDECTVFEIDAVMAILRAISKFSALYGSWSADMAAFDAWVRERVQAHQADTAAT